MKIVHICLNGFVDGWGYQENILPLYQLKRGDEVSIIASSTHHPKYISKNEIAKIKKFGNNYIFDGINMFRIPTFLQTTAVSFINIGLFVTLCKIKPDLIFHHDVTIPSIMKCILYKLLNPSVKIVVDNHADSINESKNKVWKFVYNNFTKCGVKFIQSHINIFYGVTPARCDYLKETFGVSPSKIKLLPIGADTDKADNIDCCIKELKQKYNIPEDSIVIVSGGKMGVDKGTIELINAFDSLKKLYPSLILLLFGRFTDDETKHKAERIKNVYIHGWCDRQKTFELLKLSDVACWPYLHTTLIEDAIACGIPLVIKKSGNTIHSVNGNGILLNKGDQDELYDAINIIISSNEYGKYRSKSLEFKRKFSYDNLAKQIYEDCTQ